jgi:O-antigen/teichoic acid export membrane protein
MGVSLYTSRVVLNTLGVDDFGIYNVVGGVVAMFSLLSGSLSAAVSRFLTFELGKGDNLQLKKVFAISVEIHIVLAVSILLFAEFIGVWFLNTKMNISESRIVAANWVLQCSIFTFIINLISVPYNAAIIAHENMKAFAYISIVEVLLKLIIVYTLFFILFDKLIVYAILLLVVAIIIRIIYGVYCKRKFEECSIHLTYDKKLVKEIAGFAGWNFIGSSSVVLRDQGVNIVLNIFCGTLVNAARGISFQVNNAINGFATNFMTAINPQITKSYALGDYKYMMNLIQQGARLSFYLLFIISLPVLIETNQILTLWLKIVPEHTVAFVRLILIFAMLESISGTLITAMLATGRIRNYQIVVGGLQLLNFPVSYILLKNGLFPEITMVIAIVISMCCLIARLWMLKSMIHISIKRYIINVIINVVITSFIAASLPCLIMYVLEPSFLRFLLILFFSFFSSLVVIYFIGCSKNEQLFIKNKVEQLKTKFIAKKI